jgi:hypothetical protein
LIVLADLDDEVIVGDYVFWGFRKAGENAVYFLVRRLDEREVGEGDSEKVESILRMMDLWEDTISLAKCVWPEISYDAVPEGRVEMSYRPNKYLVEKGKVYFDMEVERKLAYGIKFSTDEGLRRTRGRSTATNIEIEYLRERLGNVNKWMMLSNIRKSLLI